VTREVVLERLREHKDFLKERYGVLKIGLFGSYAKGEATQESDIDIFVELRENRFRTLASLWVYLEEMYSGAKIDLVNKHKNAKSRLFESIEKETIFV